MTIVDWLRTAGLGGPPRVLRIKLRAAQAGVIGLDDRALWKKQGWRQKGNRYSGWYRTRFGAWKGVIDRRGDIFKPYIMNPPLKQVKKHPRWICFHKVKGDWWRIDLAINPAGQDVDSVLFNLERILHESFELK